MTLDEAIELFKGEMRLAMWTDNSQDRYSRELGRFATHVNGGRGLADVGVNDARSFLNTFNRHAASTVALEHTILSSFWKFLVLNEYAVLNPMDRIKRPKVPALRDRKRVRITSLQVESMLSECEGWPEILCVHTLAYLGVRRTALANLRWRDVDGKQWTATFQEKGRKRITKPVPHRLRAIYTAYALERSGQGDPIDPDEWVVPNKRKSSQLDKRSPRIIYVLVTDVAKRCGVKAHVHAFRAAFAVHFLRNNPSNLEALRQLMGHTSISTTQGYLDELEGQDAMRVVEGLEYGSAS